MWTYQQSTGQLSHDGEPIGTGYAGHGTGVNDPAMQDQHNVGPVPQGKYTIGPSEDRPNSIGAFALPLTPDPANQMFGRTAFFIHGDNMQMNHTASDGCIVIARTVRNLVASSGDRQLTVIA